VFAVAYGSLRVRGCFDDFNIPLFQLSDEVWRMLRADYR
jgi:hypothetical protein